MSDYSYEDIVEGHEIPAFAFTVAEAGQMSGLSRSSIYLAVQDGELPGRKRGRRTLILAEDLKKFLQALPTCKT